MKKGFFILLFLIFGLKASATHIVGGDMVYRFLSRTGNNITYEVKLNIYIDCINGTKGAIDHDLLSSFFVFEILGTKYNGKDSAKLNDSYSLGNARSIPVKVADLNYKCIKNKPNACVDWYIFTRTITVPANNLGYIVSFERCCRNNTINNIINPESTGATFWTKIPPANTYLRNNSPRFKNLPPNFLCTNAPLNFDHGAIDPDGDSLVYELFTPFHGATRDEPVPNSSQATNPANFRNIYWGSGYNQTMQIDGNPTLTIDRFNGRLSLTPTRTGQFVIGIRVLEFRNGVLIGDTKRDFQFNVAECVFDVVSSFFLPNYNICQNQEVQFINRSIGATTYKWDFGEPEKDDDTSIGVNPFYTYKTPGKYNVRLIAKTNICKDTTDIEINIAPQWKIKLPEDTIICGPFSMTLRPNRTDKNFIWNSGERTPTIRVNRGGTYFVIASDNSCVSRDTMNIINDLSLIEIGPDSVICRDSFVQFTYEGADPNFAQYLWNDGSTDQSVFISQLGTYHVRAVSQYGCVSYDTITFVLYPPPRVYLRDTTFCKNTFVTLDGRNFNQPTRLETRYTWNTGQTDPIINVDQDGLYVVTVKNRLCTIFDTAVLKYYETGLDLGPDTFYCGPVFRRLAPKPDYVRYLWHDDGESKEHIARSPGKKKITIWTIEGCVESDSVFITQYPKVDGGLGNDTVICLSSGMELKAADSMESYLWNTGETSQAIYARRDGMYIVTVRNVNDCVVSDTINIKQTPDALPIDMFMPNAFSPNDDNSNETYPGNKYSDPGSPYLLRLYNRWGEKIFESYSPTMEWDGKIDGVYAPMDVYVYYVKYTGCDEVERWFRGTFTLLR